MRILSFSYCFPSGPRPTWGVFVLQRVAAMGRRAPVTLEAVSPAPTFPVLTRLAQPMPPAEETLDGLRVHHPRFFYIPAIAQDAHGRMYARGLRNWLSRQIDRFRPDLLDAHFIWPDGVGVAGLARQFGLPYAITLRGKLYPCLERPSQRAQCADALAGAVAVISVSGAMAREAIDLGTPADRVHVIPNGVDRTLFAPADQAEARASLGLPAAGRLLVSVGHLGVRKGSRDTIHALAALDDDVRLVLVGGDSRGGRDAAEIRSLADELGLGNRVILPGPQPYDRVAQYFAAADVGVLPSYREGCPNVVLECLASGRPVVASRVGAVPDIVRDGADGRLVGVQDIDGLTEALRDVLDRPWDAEALSQAPGVRSWDEVAESVMDIFWRAVPGAAEGNVDEGPRQT